MGLLDINTPDPQYAPITGTSDATRQAVQKTYDLGLQTPEQIYQDRSQHIRPQNTNPGPILGNELTGALQERVKRGVDSQVAAQKAQLLAQTPAIKFQYMQNAGRYQQLMLNTASNQTKLAFQQIQTAQQQWQAQEEARNSVLSAILTGVGAVGGAIVGAYAGAPVQGAALGAAGGAAAGSAINGSKS